MPNSTDINYVISEPFDNWFCILSNLVCIFPSYLFYIDNNYFDSCFIFIAGLVSFLYHANNGDYHSKSNNIISVFDYDSIRLTDWIIAYLTILNVASYLAFYKQMNIRSVLLLIKLPIVIYLTLWYFEERMEILYISIGVLALRVIYNLYKLEKFKLKYIIYLLVGISFNIVQIYCFTIGNKNENIYNFFHGLHHLFGFISIIFYFFVPKFVLLKDPVLVKIASNLGLNNLENQEKSNRELELTNWKPMKIKNNELTVNNIEEGIVF